MLPLRHICHSLLFILLAGEVVAQRFDYADEPLRRVIVDVQHRTSYRFLYRDALIAGKRISFSSDRSGLISSLERALESLDLALQHDVERSQIVIFESGPAGRPATDTITGYVVDGESGSRLPWATITWYQNGRFYGVTSNDAGAFLVDLDAGSSEIRQIALNASYVGYRSSSIRIELDRPIIELTFRLQPEPVSGQEVVISSSNFTTDLDTTWYHMIDPSSNPQLGERSVIRALQALPAVAISGAQANGLNVRGSNIDGFQVLLDGIPIYNQNHFFGMFDAFNADALQRIGFHYGVAPAHLAAPPGGTLAFSTRTGSQNGFGQAFGLTNTSYRGTVEGPLVGGNSSFLVSGRHSYLNAVNWFNNTRLIAWGLDVGRETSPLPADRERAETRIISPGPVEARFYDLHGKLQLETIRGSRIMANMYLGGDNTRQDYERLIEAPSHLRAYSLIDRVTVASRNTWGNEAGSLQFQHALAPRVYSHSLFAVSHYRAKFFKEDFQYTRAHRQLETSRSFISSFENENSLFEMKLEQHLDISPTYGGSWTAGYSLHRYTVNYKEESALRPAFDSRFLAGQFDVFGGYELRGFRPMHLSAGLRSHYYSNGNYLRLSPRLFLQMWPEDPVSITAGYSRNHQFLHQIYLRNITSADNWIMSTDTQPPAGVDNVLAGASIRPAPGFSIQLEAYWKRYHNMRLHEISMPLTEDQTNSLFEPWYYDNAGYSRGLEVMARQRAGALLLTAGYSLSRMEIQNQSINRGQRFRAPWDQMHQLVTSVDYRLSRSIQGQLVWMYGTGNPNMLALFDRGEAEQLTDYHRLDAAISYNRRVGWMSVEIKASIFNLYDRKNTWYRNPVGVINTAIQPNNLEFVNVDVYDLGFQPSFEILLSF